MKTLFAVTRTRGRAWDTAKPLRAQEQWDEHAAFMTQLATDRFIVLGGPIGDEGEVLHIIDAVSEEQIRTTLARDPWSRLALLDEGPIRAWTILLDSVGITARGA